MGSPVSTSSLAWVFTSAATCPEERTPALCSGAGLDQTYALWDLYGDPGSPDCVSSTVCMKAAVLICYCLVYTWGDYGDVLSGTWMSVNREESCAPGSM
jgi:hypothetical protein